jgi:hypothetical protein
VTETDQADRLATYELLNDELKDKLKQQAESAVRVDTKAAIVVGFAVTALQLFIPRFTHWWLALPAVAAYALAIIFGVATLAVRSHASPPRPQHLVDEYRARVRREVLGVLIGARVKAHEENRKSHLIRVRYWWVSLHALVGAVAFSSLDLLLERV